MKQPTLQQLISFVEKGRWPNNAYVRHPLFSALYVRIGDVRVRLGGDLYHCVKTVQVANIQSKKPGCGAFATLVDEILSKGYAVFVECVHNERFRGRLERLGFVLVDSESFNYIKGQEGHLKEITNFGGENEAQNRICQQ